MLNEREKQSPGTTASGARSGRTDMVFRPVTRAVAALLVMFLTLAQAWAQNPAAPPSLKTIPIPQPSNLDSFVKSRPAAIALGKALFWDMQVGSDAVQACASCHFNAGADIRSKNVISPGLNAGDTTFQSVAGANTTVDVTKYPFTKFADPGDRTTALVSSSNDVTSSPGVNNTTYLGQPKSAAVEQGLVVPDAVFHVASLNTRRVEPRNAPTVINAVYNFTNFWDGRANPIFNGSSPWGDADPNAGVWINNGGVVTKQRVRIPMSSLASQAVGPPGSPFEMSFAGRTFPEIGRKLLNSKIVPLGKQGIHPTDSVLGSLSNSTTKNGKVTLNPGLKTTYAAMVQAAFNDQFWNYGGAVTVNGTAYNQMEANFALFFGLAIQMYEATLVSDDSPYDRFQEGNASALSASAQEGLNIFLQVNEQGGVGGNCINCHGTSTFSNASVMHIAADNFGASLPEGVIERMTMGDLNGAWYDSGFYNIGVRPFDEDLGRGGKDAFGNPLSFIERSMMVFNGQTSQLSYDPFATNPAGVVQLPCGPNDPFGRVCPADQRMSTTGSFKVPTLRNIDLTGPYMHNGGEATLMQVIDFYSRGGNFFEKNFDFADPDVEPLFGLNPNPILQPGALPNAGSGLVAEANQRKLIDFLMSLTDERVRQESAPFDHPELLIPNGASTKSCGTQGQACDVLLKIPAVGKDGRAAQKLPPVGRFLNLDPYQP